MQHQTNVEATTLAYERWLHESHSPAHARRTAVRNAAFLLPHVTPGMRLLDAGCGPGSITIGLATAVAGGSGDQVGEAIGIDLNEHSIESARAAAKNAGVENARFESASIYALPFADDTFDAAFSHAVMQHLSDPLAALAELHRVLKPGGVIGVADADLSGSLIHPSSPALDRSFELMIRLRHVSGGTSDAGRRLRSLLADAGFARTAASVIADADGARETTARTGGFWASYYESPPLIAHVVALGLASAADLGAISGAWRAWGTDAGAFWARFWCQAIGWK